MPIPSNQSTAPLYPSPQQVSYIGFNASTTSPNQYPTKKQQTKVNDNIEYPSVPDSLPNIPDHANNNSSDSFDDLAARFEKLKKK